ncbi:MAG: hypothetical protein SOX31_04730 [Eubacteriales bacterium]|nr:hypothetical protein [Eubacteriales bacterium]MDY3285865.1 hypothetical protein [Eubacteriales bacterium]
MNPAIYIAIFMPLLLMLWAQRYESRRLLMKHIRAAKKRRGENPMQELAKRFIGKECLIYTFGNQLTGTITEVTDGAILVDNKSETEAVNLDFVVRIREYPRGKNGKKKSVVLD